MVKDGMIDEKDMGFIQLIDEPAYIVEAIFAFYEARDIEPLEDERQKGLYL